MKTLKWLAALCVFCFAAASAFAGSISCSSATLPTLGDSCTGNLANAQDYVQITFSISGAETLDFQTWSFGGGTNAAGQSISAGGFDPFLAVFSGAGSTAMIVTANGNPAGTSDSLTNFTTGFGTGLPGDSFVGCGPAGTVAFNNGDNVCGDVKMSLSLSAGTYTLILSDGSNPANAVFDLGSLGEGFGGLSSTVFQTCDTNETTHVQSCISPSNAFAFDITGGPLTFNTPEPGVPLQLGISFVLLLGFGLFERARRRQHVRAQD